MRRGNDGGLFCHILETGAIGSHLFDKYRQSSTFFQRQNRFFPPDTPPAVLFRFVLLCSLFFPGKEKRTRKESHKPAWVGPPRPPVSGACVCLQKIFCGFFFFVLFLSVKEKEPKRKLRNPPGLARCARPSAALAFPAKNILRGFSFRKAPQGKTESACRGRPARWSTLIPLPDKVSFLWFFLFFSRKKRKNREREKTKRSRGCAAACADAPESGVISYLIFTAAAGCGIITGYVGEEQACGSRSCN